MLFFLFIVLSVVSKDLCDSLVEWQAVQKDYKLLANKAGGERCGRVFNPPMLDLSSHDVCPTPRCAVWGYSPAAVSTSICSCCALLPRGLQPGLSLVSALSLHTGPAGATNIIADKNLHKNV